MDSTFTLTTTKKTFKLKNANVLLEYVAKWHRLFEEHNHQRQNVDLLLQTRVRAINEWMGSTRFVLTARARSHEIENEMYGYHIHWSGRARMRTHTHTHTCVYLLHQGRTQIFSYTLLLRTDHQYLNGQHLACEVLTRMYVISTRRELLFIGSRNNFYTKSRLRLPQ